MNWLSGSFLIPYPGDIARLWQAVGRQFLEDVDDPSVAQIRAIFLEGKAEYEHPGSLNLDAILDHLLDELVLTDLRDAGGEALLTSFGTGEGSPQRFYEKLGFKLATN